MKNHYIMREIQKKNNLGIEHKNGNSNRDRLDDLLLELLGLLGNGGKLRQIACIRDSNATPTKLIVC
jgi:hypothetical protein